jgi:uncharacterized membrane protein
MSNTTHSDLRAFICLLSFGGLLFGLFSMLFSKVFFFELDYSDEQRQVADFRSSLVSFFGFVVVVISILSAIFSRVISELVLKKH